MKTIRISGVVDEEGMLHAQVPPTVLPGPVEVMISVPPGTELQRSGDWMSLVARHWKAELSDSDEDIYRYSDGEPVDGTR